MFNTLIGTTHVDKQKVTTKVTASELTVTSESKYPIRVRGQKIEGLARCSAIIPRTDGTRVALQKFGSIRVPDTGVSYELETDWVFDTGAFRYSDFDMSHTVRYNHHCCDSGVELALTHVPKEGSVTLLSSADYRCKHGVKWSASAKEELTLNGCCPAHRRTAARLVAARGPFSAQVSAASGSKVSGMVTAQGISPYKMAFTLGSEMAAGELTHSARFEMSSKDGRGRLGSDLKCHADRQDLSIFGSLKLSEQMQLTCSVPNARESLVPTITATFNF